MSGLFQGRHDEPDNADAAAVEAAASGRRRRRLAWCLPTRLLRTSLQSQQQRAVLSDVITHGSDFFCVTGTHARTHTAEEQNAVRHTFPQPLSVTWRCGAAPWRHGEIQTTTTGCCDERQSAGAVNQFYIRSPFSHLVCLSSPAPRLAGPASDVPQAAAAASTAPESH